MHFNANVVRNMSVLIMFVGVYMIRSERLRPKWLA